MQSMAESLKSNFSGSNSFKQKSLLDQRVAFLLLRMIFKEINHREGIDITPSVAIRMNKPDQVPFTTFI